MIIHIAKSSFILWKIMVTTFLISFLRAADIYFLENENHDSHANIKWMRVKDLIHSFINEGIEKMSRVFWKAFEDLDSYRQFNKRILG